jgi:hypothetical protein
MVAESAAGHNHLDAAVIGDDPIAQRSHRQRADAHRQQMITDR